MKNIRSLAIAGAAEMPVCDAAGAPQIDEGGQALSITLYGPGTKQYQAARHAQDERNSTRVFSRMQGKSDKASAESKNRERAEFLAQITVSFNNFDLGPEGPNPGPDLFKAVYGDIELGHIADDAEKFVTDRSNFMLPFSKKP